MINIYNKLSVKAIYIISSLFVLFYFCIVQLSGGSALEFLLYIILSIVLIFSVGELILSKFKFKFDTLAKISLWYILGVSFIWLNYAIVGTLQNFLNTNINIMYFMFLAPFFLGLYNIVVKFKNNKNIEVTFRNLENKKYIIGLFSLCFCIGIFIYAFTGVLAFAHSTSAGNMQYHQDMLWSVGNGAAVQLGFPLKDIRVLGGQPSYHYLADAVPGFIAFAGNILPYNASCYYNYPILLFVFISAAISSAKLYLSCNNKLPEITNSIIASFFPICLLFLQGFQSDNTLNLLRNMNGVIAATAITCTVLYLIFYLQKENFFECDKLKVKISYVALFSISIFVLILSKNLYGILIICSLAASVIFALIIQKRFYKTPALATVASLTVLAILWVTVFNGAINNLVQSFWISPYNLFKTIILWLPVGIVLYVISLIINVLKITKISFSQLVVNAAAVGGLMAYFLFNHYSASQTYFMLAAILFIWYCALDALPQLIEYCKTKGRKNLVLLCTGILVVISLFGTTLTILPEMRKGVQIIFRCLNIRPEYPYQTDSVTSAEEEAALWLRDNLKINETFATNRNAKDMQIGEGTWHYLTAMSGRQSYVESWRYAMDYSIDYYLLRHNLEQISDVIFNETDYSKAFSLAKENNIDYLVINTNISDDLFKGIEPVFQKENMYIYKVY